MKHEISHRLNQLLANAASNKLGLKEMIEEGKDILREAENYGYDKGFQDGRHSEKNEEVLSICMDTT